MTKKNVLVISSSPRKRGNSELLCERFVAGAEASGHEVETIRLSEQKIGFCTGCGTCFEGKRPCPQKDDMSAILEKMIAADVLVLASPVYFYTMAAQMKVLIDRTCARYTEIRGKDIYLLVTAADGNSASLERTVDGFRGFLDCLDGCREAGVVYGAGAWQKGDIEGTAAMDEAYSFGLGA